MKESLRQKLIDLAKEKITKEDISHDLQHSLRVLALAEKIAKEEGADFDIIVPAALFHDVVIYPKNNPRSKNESEESARYTAQLLEDIEDYPKNKIRKVQTAIEQCSFSKRIMPELLEAKVLQDADRLEATGAISIMRTFSSTGQMKRPFYKPEDPFCKNREPEPKRYALDLFYARLLKVESGMHTKKAKELAKERTGFLRSFLEELKNELDSE